MSRSERILVAKSVVSSWIQASERSDELVAFSPYVTSDTAERVLCRGSDAKTCSLYTLFDALVFIQGASSLRTLRRLINKGVRLFALPDLHAKMVIVPGQFASIGSQNLTAGGTKNKESSVVIRDERKVQAVVRAVAGWRNAARPISVEMIAEMESLIRPFQRKRRQLLQQAQAIDKAVTESEQKRIAAIERERRRRIDAERERQERLRWQGQASRAWEASARRSRERIRAKVVQDASGGYILRPTVHAHLTEWRLSDGTPITLDSDGSFYPCMIEGSWKFGFVRLKKTRITFIGNGVDDPEWYTVAGRRVKVAFSADWDDDAASNLVCTLKAGHDGGWTSLQVPATFNLDSLMLGKPELERPSYHFASYESKWSEYSQWFRDHQDDIAKELTVRLLTPFRYARPLNNARADQFFGELFTRFVLRVGVIRGYRILVARKF